MEMSPTGCRVIAAFSRNIALPVSQFSALGTSHSELRCPTDAPCRAGRTQLSVSSARVPLQVNAAKGGKRREKADDSRVPIGSSVRLCQVLSGKSGSWSVHAYKLGTASVLSTALRGMPKSGFCRAALRFFG